MWRSVKKLAFGSSLRNVTKFLSSDKQMWFALKHIYFNLVMFFNKLGRKLWLTWNVTFKREAESAFLDGNATIQTPNMICSFIIFYTDLHKAKAIQNTATTFKNSGSPPISSLFPGHEFAQELYDKSRCPAKNVFWRRSLQRCDATQKNSEHLAEAAW